MLSDDEQLEIWSQKLESSLKNSKMNSAQKELVKSLVEINEVRFTLSESEFTVFKDSWIGEAEKVFSTEQIRSLAFQLNDMPDFDNQSARVMQEDPSQTGCNCNRGSVFSCGLDFICPDAASPCKNPQPVGCGFLFMYPCNQICMFLFD